MVIVDLLTGVFLAGGIFAIGPNVSSLRQIIALLCFALALNLATVTI